MHSRFSFWTILLLVFLLIDTTLVYAQYIQKDKILTTGQTATLTTGSAKELTITYRPGSDISQTRTVPLHEAAYNWTPKKAGIYALSTPEGGAQTVSVRFGSFPLQGLIVMIIAGGILFGGAIYAAVNLFARKKETAIA